MLINAAPADEIAEIRGQIQMLKEREAALRRGFLTGLHSRRGHYYEVRVEPARMRRLLQDKLPPEILNNPAFWDDQVTQRVLVKPCDTQSEPDDAFDLFEPFD